MEMNLLLVHMKYIRYPQHIIRLVQINDMFVSTWKYTLVVTHEIHSMLVACYVLVHGNDNVIYTSEIQQIHVTIYWVSTYKGY